MGCRKYFFFYLIFHFLGRFLYNPQIKGSFENHVDMIFWFFHQPPSSVVIFYVLNMDKYGKFLTRYPPSVVYITVGLNLEETIKKILLAGNSEMSKGIKNMIVFCGHFLDSLFQVQANSDVDN